MATRLSKKRVFIKKGLLNAELDAFFRQILSGDGYVGMEINPRGANTDIVLNVNRPQIIIGEKGRRIHELTALVLRKFDYDAEKTRMFVKPIEDRGLSATIQCEALRFKLSKGIPVRRACYAIIKTVMERKARGVEIEVSGKIRGQRAKSMKFINGIMIHAGEPAKLNVDKATRCVFMKQGVLGIKVKINQSPVSITSEDFGAGLPDRVIVYEPKEELKIIKPHIKCHDEKVSSSQDPESQDIPEQRFNYRSRYERSQGYDRSQQMPRSFQPETFQTPNE